MSNRTVGAEYIPPSGEASGYGLIKVAVFPPIPEHHLRPTESVMERVVSQYQDLIDSEVQLVGALSIDDEQGDGQARSEIQFFIKQADENKAHNSVRTLADLVGRSLIAHEYNVKMLPQEP